VNRVDRGEDGIYTVFLAVLIVVLLGFAALALDLVTLREARASNRSATDLVATSAALSLSESGNTNMVKACQDAWGYVAQNVAGAGGGPIDCTPFASVCNAASERTVTATTGPYTVKITNPVLDLSPDTVGDATQAGDAAIDGTPCERIAVQITETRSFAFAEIFGFRTGTTTSRSVGRALSGNLAGEADALIVLEDTDCQALVASGQGKIHVKAAGASPGGIIVDSAATTACNGGKHAIEVDHNNGRIIADPGSTGTPGSIKAFALAPGQGNANAYDSGDVATGHLVPRPIARSRRVTRAPVDWEYNCTSAGFDGIAGSADDCVNATASSAYIDALRARYGAGVPGGFSTYSGPCATAPNDPPVTLSGNVFVNCPTFTVKNQFSFRGGDVVFAGAVDVQGGRLSINDAANDNPSTDHIVYVRNGGIDKDAQAELHLPKVFVYLANGTVDLGAGSGKVVWTAPYSGNFDKLALWSESAAQHAIGGQASLTLDGVFFTPNAKMSFTGQGSFDQVRAQFISNKLVMSGQGELVMQPDPTRIVLVPVVGARLIR
jgi:hypothetical protein